MPNKKQKILVTGGAGFIASHIVDEYISLGHRVVVIDNLLTGSRRNLNPEAKFYKADITDLPAMKEIMRKERPTIINHHAAIAEVAKSLYDPISTMKTNVLGTINILLSAGAIKLKKIIFASSGGTVYGEPRRLPVDENCPLGPISPYGLSKIFGEQCITFYSKVSGFKYLIFRYANAYGPRQNPKGEAGVVAIFSGLIKAGKKPVIFGDGNKTRDYLFVKDIVRANVQALTMGENEIFNLGTAKQTRDQDVFDGVAHQFGFKDKPTYLSLRKGEANKMSLSYKKAKEALNWEPTVNFKDGLIETVNWYKDHYKPLN